MEAFYVLLFVGGVIVVMVLALNVRRTRRDPERKVAWTPISNLIGGGYSSTSGFTYNRYKISGSYQGRPVEVFIEAHAAEDMPTFYSYHLKIKVGSNRYDWAIRYGEPKYLATQAGRYWHVQSIYPALTKRLADAGAIELVKQATGKPHVSYNADAGTLEYERSVESDTSIPAPAEFAAQFNLLTQLADLNEKLNV